MSMLRFLLLALLLTGSALAAAPTEDRQGVRWAGLPIFNYTTDLGLSAGAMVQRFDYGAKLEARQPFQSLWTVELSHASRGPRSLIVAYEKTRAWDSPWRVAMSADYDLNPFDTFYGIGADTVRDPALARLDYYIYRFESGGVAFGGRRPIGDFELALGISGSRESSLAPAIPSLFGDTQGQAPITDTIVRTSAALIWERRDSEFVPSQGWRGSIALSTGVRTHGPPWPRLDLDYRRYDPLIEDRYLVLASQFRATFAGNNAPIHDKARLGSLSTLRGLPSGRYLANESASLRTELRTVLFRFRIFDLPLKLGGGLFADLGKAGMTPSDLVSSPLRSAWGFTLFGSYFTDDFLGSMDVGFSQGSTAVYLRIGHAF